MLPKINRLKNTRDIEWVFKKGLGFKEGFLFLKLAKNRLGVARVAFVVSQKISKKAAVRNRIKRRLRESAKSLAPCLKTGLDMVVVAQAGIENKTSLEIKNNLSKLFQKANLT